MGEGLDVNKIHCCDVLEGLKKLPDESINTVCTSPPYWGLRDYGVEGQLGLEPTLDEYLDKMLSVTKELQRVLKKSGVLFWNHGDCYGGSGQGAQTGYGDYKRERVIGTMKEAVTKSAPPKCLAMQNYRLVQLMVDNQGWILRNVVVWHKPNHMPSSVKDRFANAYEPVFMLTKAKKYWFDLDAVRKAHSSYKQEMKRTVLDNKGAGYRNDLSDRPRDAYYDPLGKNPGDVWKLPTQPFPEAHFAVFPEKLVKPMVKAGCPKQICVKCGFVRERIVATEYVDDGPNRMSKKKEDWGVAGKSRWAMFNADRTMKALHKTKGWTTCDCGSAFRPGIVLDPFMGSGTTALVAKKLGRDYIGIEISEEYVKIAEKRLEPWKNQTRLGEII